MSGDNFGATGRIQNSETGEIEHLNTDNNTDIIRRVEFDAETGESEESKIVVRYRKKRSFQIPREYLRNTEDDYLEQPSCSKKLAEYNPFDKEELIHLDGVNRDIILGFTKSSYLIFLIPSVFCFTKVTAFLILALESALHCLAHHKNRCNTNNYIFYQSPLHILTSQFCSHCRAESEMDFISKYHKIVSSSININFKDMTKVIG